MKTIASIISIVILFAGCYDSTKEKEDSTEEIRAVNMIPILTNCHCPNWPYSAGFYRVDYNTIMQINFDIEDNDLDAEYVEMDEYQYNGSTYVYMQTITWTLRGQTTSFEGYRVVDTDYTFTPSGPYFLTQHNKQYRFDVTIIDSEGNYSNTEEFYVMTVN